MDLRKIIITVFIVISLNLSFQAAPAFSQGKNLIVLVQEKREDDVTNDFIKENRKKSFEKLVSLTFMIMLIDSGTGFYNTS